MWSYAPPGILPTVRSSSSVSFRVVLGKGHSSRQLPTSLFCLLRVQNCQELDPCFPLLLQSINVMPYSPRLQSHAWNIATGVGTIGLGAAFLSLCPPRHLLGHGLSHTYRFIWRIAALQIHLHDVVDQITPNSWRAVQVAELFGGSFSNIQLPLRTDSRPSLEGRMLSSRLW